MRLHHGGHIVRTRDDSVEFEDMFEDVLIFSESPSLTQLVDRVKVRLGWSEVDVLVQFEGVIDVGSCKGQRIKRLLKLQPSPNRMITRQLCWHPKCDLWIWW